MRIRIPSGRWRRGARRSGIAALEFAVVAPVLVVFILGIVEIGRAVMVAQIAVNASREAVRYAAQGSATSSTITTYTQQYLTGVNIPSSALASLTIEYQTSTTSGGTTSYSWTTTTDPTTVSQGTPLRATVNITYSAVTWLPTNFFVGSGYQVSGQSVDRKE